MSLADYKFLVVDDHLLMRLALSKALEEAGVAKIDQAADGQDAMHKIQEATNAGEPYGVICLDWAMPNMTGLEVLKLCRKDRKLDGVAIVMVTVESEESSVILAIEEGATSYIRKPIELDALIAKLQELTEWLEGKHAPVSPG